MDFPYMIGSMYVGAFREDEEDVIDNICGPFGDNGYATMSHFWNADLGDNSPPPINITENAYKKIKKLWYGNYTLGISVGHQYSQTSHWTIKVKFGPNGDGDLATAYNHIRSGDLNYLVVTKDKGYYDHCEENNFANINLGFYDYWHNKGWSDNEIKNKAKIIIFESLGRICHLLGDMAVPAHAHNSMHIDWDYYESSLGTFYNNEADKITWESPNVYNNGIVNVNALNNPLKGLAYLVNQSSDRMPSLTCGPLGQEKIDGNVNWIDNVFNGGDFGFFYNNLNPYYASIIDVPLNAHLSNDICKKIHKYTFPIAIRSIAGFIDYFFKNTTDTIRNPQILNIYQNPFTINQGTVGVITCNLIDGLDPYDYEWTWSSVNDIPINKSFQGYYNKCNVHWHNPSNIASKIKDIDKWRLKVEVKKKGGSVIASTFFYPNFTSSIPPPTGCPWLIVTDQDTNYNFDNNLLHMSQLPENQGNFITDKYVLKTKPGIFDGKIKFSIVETNIDSTLINSIKLYSVQHPSGTILGVTANNEIVYFDSASVIQNDRASLFDSSNNYANITNDIKFHNPMRGEANTNGDSLYHIYAEFNKNSTINNPAVISYLQRGILDPITPIAKDNFSGNLFINNTNGSSQYPFMRRENPDIIISPLTEKDVQGSVDSIHIAWDKSFKIKYAAVASLNYSGFSVSELPLVTAFHTSNGDVLSSLLANDSNYTYISPNAYLNLEFSSTPIMKPQVITDYVVEINGQVIYLGNNKIKSLSALKPNQNITPDKYSLSQNYPNPFNPVTKINFALPKQGFVTLKIYDVLGREVRTLVNEVKSAGNFSVDFNASEFASGVYFYR